jgi:hypothetical protein
LIVDIITLTLGVYTGQIEISSSNATNSPVYIPITLYIRPENGILYVPQDYSTIQDAIDVALSEDTVIIDPGTYTGLGNRDIDFLGKAIVVRSVDPNDPSVVASTIIDAQGTPVDKHRGFIFQNGEDLNSVLEGLTITGGTTVKGAGISINTSSPTIKNCNIMNNSNTETSSYGAGIYCLRGSPVISHCSIINNTVRDRGAGIYTYGQYDGSYCPVISNCNISDNTATFRSGGGISCWSESVIIENCTVLGNHANDGGGGIEVLYGEEAIIANCLIVDNTSNYTGGGMEVDASKFLIQNNTIANNVAADHGGGVFFLSSAHDDIDLINNIIWGNEPEQIYLYYDLWPTVTHTDIEGGWEGVGNIDADPEFVDAVNGDYHLMPDSPCVDAGDPGFVAGEGEVDIDGEPRVMGGRVDIGVDEYNPLVIIEVEMKLTPEALYVNSKGKLVFAHVTMPEEIEIIQDDIERAVLNGQIEAVEILLSEGKSRIVTVEFDRGQLSEYLTGEELYGEVELVVNIELDGEVLQGRDVIKVMEAK